MLAFISLIISIISGLAALVAILGYWSNKRELIQFMETSSDSYSALIEGQIFYHNDKGERMFLPSGVLVHYQFLTPSPNDIAYFHMGFIVNDKIVPSITERSVVDHSKHPTFKLYDLKSTTIIQLPKDPQGVFKANSLTPIYGFLPIEYGPVPDEVKFYIRFAIRKFPYIGKRNHYQTFEHTIKLTNFEMITKSNSKVMQQLSQFKTSHSKKHTKSKRKK